MLTNQVRFNFDDSTGLFPCFSKRWHKGQGHTKVEMGTLGAASGYSFMKPSAAAAAHANFQMSVEERLRWAQMAEAIGHQNLYAVSVSWSRADAF